MKLTSRGRIQRRILTLAFLAGAILFFVFDIVVDLVYKGESGSWHFYIEVIVFAGVSMALVLGLRDMRKLRRLLIREERRNILFSTALVETIDDQMDEWRLTRSEKDVAWFIIKGYRFTEIAKVRGVKESTSRLQATSLYSKAGVSGRAEFVAEIMQPFLMSFQNAPSEQKNKTEPE